MNPKQNKNIYVSETYTRNDNVFVTFKIPNYKNIINRISIGEHITTIDPFDLNFSDFASKMLLFFYPRGQYDYGLPSKNCRAYVKMLSCTKNDPIIKMDIKVCVGSSSTAKDSEFILNDFRKNWTGPFDILTPKEVYFNDELTITLTFELIRNERKDFFAKKRLSSPDDGNQKYNKIRVKGN